MNKLEELINNLCPNGVEYKELRDISCMERGTSATKKDFSIGEIPAISGGKEPAFYCDKSNREGDTITVAGSGAGAGFVQFWNKPIFVCDAFSIKGYNFISTKYLYYYLTQIQVKISKCKTDGGVPHVYISHIEHFEIPVPPMEVQNEIVRILDSFTELNDNLSKELELRRKQFEHYREDVLSNVVGKKQILGEVCKFVRGPFGGALKKEIFVKEGIAVYEQQHAINNDFSFFRYFITEEKYNTLKRFEVKSEDMIVSCSGTMGKIAIIPSNAPKGIINQALLKLTTFEGVYNRYVKYFFENTITKQVNSQAHGGAIKNVASVDVLKNIEIIIPSLEEQIRIVSILDSFDKLCNDTQEGLLAEIELRKKQYEYYREKLLTFKRAN